MAKSRLRITQSKSEIRQPKRMRETLRALGLKGYQRSVEQPDNPAIRGMISKVRHLVTVEEA
ncbi:MAG TPA: 50S ribosomal protein L30 [Gemmatimonadota bacterium]|nr:50S ribosomal protein L30 [Gemmatimonadota bacterium]